MKSRLLFRDCDFREVKGTFLFSLSFIPGGLTGPTIQCQNLLLLIICYNYSRCTLTPKAVNKLAMSTSDLEPEFEGILDRSLVLQ